MAEQHRLLAEVAGLIDAGRIRHTMTRHLGRIDAAELRQAHALVEAGTMRGKAVLEGFSSRPRRRPWAPIPLNPAQRG